MLTWSNLKMWRASGCLTSQDTYLLTYLLQRAESFLRSWLVLQLIKKFPAFYGTQKFITILTSAHHLSLSWATSIQSPQPLPTSWRSILILSFHLCLGLPNGLFPSSFPTKTLCNRWCYPLVYKKSCSQLMIFISVSIEKIIVPCSYCVVILQKIQNKKSIHISNCGQSVRMFMACLQS